MENFNNNRQDIFSMEIDETTRSLFLEMTRWTKFLSVFGFIIMGLLIVGGLLVSMFLGSTIGAMGGGGGMSSLGAGLGTVGLVFFYLIIAALYFYPIYALFKYSTGMKQALNTNNKTLFNTSLAYLKNMFRYMGWLLIIMLAIYGLIMIIGIIAATSRM